MRGNLVGSVWRLTDLALKILGLCDGTKSVAWILEEINQTCQGIDFFPPESAAHFLARALREEILELHDGPAYRPVPTWGNRSKYQPLHLTIELTDSCNLKCRHCYRDSGPHLSTHLSSATLMPFLEQAHDHGVRSVELTGGEPTLHPEFTDILESVLQRFGLVALITNGTLISPAILGILERHADRCVVQVDLDGRDSSEHECLRGISGSFRRACTAIQRLNQIGIRQRVAMSVFPGNKDSIRDTYLLATQLGATWFGASPVMEAGRALGDLILTRDELEEVLKTIVALSEEDPEVVLSAEELERKLGRRRFNCGAGSKALVIGPDGWPRPCLMVNRKFPGFRNIGDVLFDEVVCQGPLEFFDRLEPPSLEVCQGCSHVQTCLGCHMRPLLVWARQAAAGNPVMCRWDEATGFSKAISL